MKLIKVLKINILSIFSFISLVIAFLLNVTGKLILSLGTFLKYFIYLVILYDYWEEFKRINISFVLETCFTLCIVAFTMKFILMLLTFIAGLLNKGYEFLYDKYKRIYSNCSKDYGDLVRPDNKILYACLCFVYTFQNLYYKVLNLCLNLSLYIGGLLCIFLLVAIDIDSRMNYGQSIYQYLKSNAELLKSGLIIYAVICALVMFCSYRIHEWSKTINANYDYNTKNMDDFISGGNEHDNSSFSQDAYTKEEMNEFNHYYRMLIEHVETFSVLCAQFEAANNKSIDYTLRQDFYEYKTLIYSLFKELLDVKNPTFKELLSQKTSILRLDSLKDKIIIAINTINNAYAKKTVKQEFFYYNGCDTEEKLKSRYRALCKQYHPDSENGDEKIFIQIKTEYEELLNNFK